MVLLRRFGGALVLIFSAAGVACCAAGVIGIWVFYQAASERVQKGFARLDAGMQRASTATDNLRHAVGKARTNVAEAGRESGDLGPAGGKERRVSHKLKTLIQQKVGPDLENLGGRLATLSDAAVTVSSFLDSFQELLPGRTVRFEPGQLEHWEEEARQLSTGLRRLEAVVDEGGEEPGGQHVTAATSEVDLALQKCQAKADAWRSDLAGAREEIQHVRAKVRGWVTLAAVGVTILLAWVAAGQVSLFAHALRWVRG
jgi:hypothetical protein